MASLRAIGTPRMASENTTIQFVHELSGAWQEIPLDPSFLFYDAPSWATTNPQINNAINQETQPDPTPDDSYSMRTDSIHLFGESPNGQWFLGVHSLRELVFRNNT
jgi:hypothetical protein